MTAVVNYHQYLFRVPEARRLASLSGSQTDMIFVIQNCKRMEIMWQKLKALDAQLYEAFAIAAVVRYGRCFKSGVRDRLPESAISTASVALQDTHRYVLDLRDKHVAHSVNPFEENEVIVQIADHYISAEEITSISTAGGRAVGFPSDKPVQLGRLAQWWVTWLETEMKKEREMLLRLAKSFSLEALKQNEQAVLASNTGPRLVGKRRARP